MPFFHYGDVSLFYTTQGPAPGPSIVLVHGWACDGHDWSHQIPMLRSLGLYVIVLDLRGHGRSSAPPAITDYSMRAFADDVAALIQHLQIGPTIVMAHSMGTIIASILTVEYPEFVKALILAHPIYSGTPPALKIMSAALSGSPSDAPAKVAEFFENHMYTAQTPSWMKTWHIRRVLGCDGVMLAGCGEAIVDIFDKIVGQTEECRGFMKRRNVPRLVMPTNAVPGAAAWEEELGLGAEDQMCVMEEGTFSHFVCSERFNEVAREWLIARELVTSLAA